MATMLQIALWSVIVNIPIGVMAHKRKSLRFPDGVVVAGILGFALFLAHWLYWLVVILFFASSSALTKYKHASKIKQEAMQFAEKGGNRDMFQVLANSGVILTISLYFLVQNGVWTAPLLHPLSIAGITSVAVVTADTWSTELGVLSSSSPRFILNLKQRVPRGTSGGVSPRGILSTFGGSALIAATYTVALFPKVRVEVLLIVLLLVFIGGVIGSLIDSALGASIQAQFECPSCNKVTEKRFHTKCGGVKTKHVKGLKIINNDTVNFVSALIPSLITYFLASALLA